MTSRRVKHTKDEALLISVAETIGSTLGSIAAKAAAGPRAFMESDFAQSVENEGKKIARKGKSVARKVSRTASQELKSGRAAKVARRGMKRVATSSKKILRGAGRKRPATRKATRRR